MRHGKKFNHLGRQASHRSSLLANLTISLILHKRIETTLAKAKELRKYAEPLINRAKEDTTHNRRTVFSYLQSKEAVKELFSTVAEKVADRPGGYTRIIKLGNRLGDNAEVALIELVDFNEIYSAKEVEEKKTTRRSRRGTGAKKTTEDTPSAEVVETIPVAAAAEEAPATEEQAPEAPASEEEKKNEE
ncbi:50S ribosomal protein L17 [Siphonobacter sp. SORGH_AS_0500]|uniref:50S ribosomal protein L17 n=1 Tax=Siphonobacter sp. SORGH_AS_0500 TaxID=1864824 RepID=UPI000CB1FF2F|nr:50S ribosomal protein L17 [Siphonobacter sp. SORGH_AS_0500]MDR6193596.1 large subunit ribosomal protein L17 [Siphonobacter sp. SORGH_AS_0500]PKK36450.1 50S ribosomal protein L17 [Siphonobacter sp. SORGH_AS_0500]